MLQYYHCYIHARYKIRSRFKNDTLALIKELFKIKTNIKGLHQLTIYFFNFNNLAIRMTIPFLNLYQIRGYEIILYEIILPGNKYLLWIPLQIKPS